MISLILTIRASAVVSCTLFRYAESYFHGLFPFRHLSYEHMSYLSSRQVTGFQLHFVFQLRPP